MTTCKIMYLALIYCFFSGYFKSQLLKHAWNHNHIITPISLPSESKNNKKCVQISYWSNSSWHTLITLASPVEEDLGHFI